jgi:hypothetical protein
VQQVVEQGLLGQPAHQVGQVGQVEQFRQETLERLAPTELADMQEAARQRVEQVERPQVRQGTGITPTEEAMSTITLGQTITGGHFSMDTKVVPAMLEPQVETALVMSEQVVLRATLAILAPQVILAILAPQVILVLLGLQETQGLMV